MFTGIVQGMGTVRSLVGPRLVVGFESGLWPNDPLVIGESVAVSGCCLTVVETADESMAFDVSEETLRLTALGGWRENTRVNLERAMRPMDRFGGHIVQGHVDGIAQVESIQELSGSWEMVFSYPEKFSPLVVPKGSICLDGISLTIVSPVKNRFGIAVIPHTWAETTLSFRQPGDRLNVEFDALAKHVQALLAHVPLSS